MDQATFNSRFKHLDSSLIEATDALGHLSLRMKEENLPVPNMPRNAISRIPAAIGIDRNSPEDLCTDITRHILAAMPNSTIRRFVWCGGGSTLVEEDRISFGAKFVELFARSFMALRHRDKAHQLELLNQNLDLVWLGVRPLQMRAGPKKGGYRVGFDSFGGFSSISFADCASAMIDMLVDDRWIHRAPIVQY